VAKKVNFSTPRLVNLGWTRDELKLFLSTGVCIRIIITKRIEITIWQMVIIFLIF